jgi:hypothetical protein
MAHSKQAKKKWAARQPRRDTEPVKEIIGRVMNVGDARSPKKAQQENDTGFTSQVKDRPTDKNLEERLEAHQPPPGVPADAPFDVSLPEGCSFLRMGLKLPPDKLDWDAWQDIFSRVMAIQDASPWWIGDCVLYAARANRWGNFYKDWEKRTEHAYGTLRNYKSVCDKFGLSDRNDKLTFSHHAAVAGLKMEDARKLLKEAAEKGWKLAGFKKAVKAFKNPPKPDDDKDDDTGDHTSDVLNGLVSLVDTLKEDTTLFKQMTDRLLSSDPEEITREGGLLSDAFLKDLVVLERLITTLKKAKHRIEDGMAFKKKAS